MARAGGGGPRELSLEEVLKCYEQPLNEEQAWALCFQGCRAAAAAAAPSAAPLRTADIRLRGDGSVALPPPPPGKELGEGGAGPAPGVPPPVGGCTGARGTGLPEQWGTGTCGECCTALPAGAAGVTDAAAALGLRVEDTGTGKEGREVEEG